MGKGGYKETAAKVAKIVDIKGTAATAVTDCIAAVIHFASPRTRDPVLRVVPVFITITTTDLSLCLGHSSVTTQRLRLF